jgi:peptidyl-prolyl cis-trans isomerase B (cyclophilin B)
VTSLRRLTVLFAIALFVLAGCGSSDDKSDSSSKDSSASKGECNYPKNTGGGVARKVDPPPSKPVTEKATRATITTNQGVIPVTLDGDKTPCTVNSFLSLAKQGYFDKTPCHRLTSGGLYVLQCGDPSATGTGGPGYSFKDELIDNDPRLQPCTSQTDPQSGKQVCTYPGGTLAMANSGPDTNGSQFFLVYRDSPLPAAYTPFGQMNAAGLKVVRDIAAKGIAADGTAPKEPVTITSVK